MINIITACSRPENLQALYESLQGLTCKWYIILDDCKEFNLSTHFNSTVKLIVKQSKKKGKWAGSLKNEALEMISFGWVYVLDDDNILHPAFKNLIWHYIDVYHYKDAFVFNLLLPDGKLMIANYSSIKVYHINQAQFILKRELIGETRYDLDKYEDDGLFIEYIYEHNPDKFMCINEIMSYHNKLR